MLRSVMIIGFLILALSVNPVGATCDTARIVSTVFPPGAWSYIYTPGLDPAVDGSAVSVSLDGNFWAIGAGDPGRQQGLDNGDFQGLAQQPAGWIQRPVGYPATFDTTWAASAGIDGCVQDVGGNTCTVVLLSDQSDGRGYFALLTAAPVIGNYSFVQGSNSPITLAVIPTPQSSNLTSFPDAIRGSVRVESPSAGLYLDGKCPATVLSGYRIYMARVPRNAPAPTDLRRTQEPWQLVECGQAANGHSLALGSTTEVTVFCQPSTDVYFTSSLVFDSGFETIHLAQPLPAVQCN